MKTTINNQEIETRIYGKMEAVRGSQVWRGEDHHRLCIKAAKQEELGCRVGNGENKGWWFEVSLCRRVIALDQKTVVKPVLAAFDGWLATFAAFVGFQGGTARAAYVAAGFIAPALPGAEEMKRLLRAGSRPPVNRVRAWNRTMLKNLGRSRTVEIVRERYGITRREARELVPPAKIS